MSTETTLVRAFETGYTYRKYRELIGKLLQEDKTTGPEQSEFLLNYTRFNERRMDRIDGNTTLSDDISHRLTKIETPENWLVITEGWCGDASQIVPYLQILDEASDKVNMRLILRDENPEIMDRFLTNGTKSIPIVIRLNAETGELLGSWGPRPGMFQAMVEAWKVKKDIPKEAFYSQMHAAYGKDRGVEILKEVLDFLSV